MLEILFQLIIFVYLLNLYIVSLSLSRCVCTRLESYLEGKKHILKKQNLNFVFGKKKKIWFVKLLVLKNYFLEMKLKASFSKCVFNKKTWLENRLPNSPYFDLIFDHKIISVILSIRLIWQWSRHRIMLYLFIIHPIKIIFGISNTIFFSILKTQVIHHTYESKVVSSSSNMSRRI